MGAYEDQLRRIAASGEFAIPGIAQLEQQLNDVAVEIGRVASSPGWEGVSATDAQERLDVLKRSFGTMADAVGDIRNSVDTANAHRANAISKLEDLPSTVVDPSYAEAAKDATEVKVYDVNVGWVLVPAASVVGFVTDMLNGQRESAAEGAVKRLESDLAGTTRSLAVARERFEAAVPEDWDPSPVPEPEPEPEPGPGSGSGGPSYRPTGPYAYVPAPSSGGPGGPGLPGDGGTGGGPGDGSGGGPGDGSGGGSGLGPDSPITPTDPRVPGGPGGTFPGGGPGGGGSGGGSGPGVGGGVGAGILGAGAVGAGVKLAGGSVGGSIMGGAGGMGSAAGGAGRLGAGGLSGAAGSGLGGAGSSGAAGSAGSSAGAAGARGGTNIMGGGGQGAGSEEKDRARGLGGIVAPKLVDEEELGPRSTAAGAGGRDQLPAD